MADPGDTFQKIYNQGNILLEELLLSFGEDRQNAFLQNTPVRVSVWREFAADPTEPKNLLLTPNYLVPTDTAMARLRRSLARRNTGTDGCGLIGLSNCIQIDVALRDFLIAVLPHTYWWQDRVLPARQAFVKTIGLVNKKQTLKQLGSEFGKSEDKTIWRFLAVWALIDIGQDSFVAERSKLAKAGDADATMKANIARWETISRYCGTLLRLADETPANGISKDEETILWKVFFPRVARNFKELTNEVTKLTDTVTYENDRDAPIWSVDLNRPVSLAVATSRRTVKADAAEKLFGDTSDKIRWAVIDSGIDAAHPAFQARDKSASGVSAANSRIIATYDFNRLLSLFKGEYTDLVPEDVLAELRKIVKARIKSKPNSLDDAILMHLYKSSVGMHRRDLSTRDLKSALQGDEDFALEVREYVEDIRRLVSQGRTIDWPLVEPLLRVSHDDGSYMAPENIHGTHVAGILAGDLKTGELSEKPDFLPREDYQGVCPSMKLYDLRVCDSQGRGKEFQILAALQFIGYLNRDRDLQLVHGANISLSLKHDVRDYACGQTPVCREANRLVGDGVVIVAAAGNLGFQRVSTEAGLIDAYNAISITDPGNAEDVITVGSTYREQPHTYGVSYFSSRGPTGDGRQKPDLVAPGERIWAPIPDRRISDLSGTSMAAPHVSGAAAVLMARHSELIGRPKRVKDILCQSATDLGREGQFQGHGLVDVLRALQCL